jgi:predicted dehydrogenase
MPTREKVKRLREYVEEHRRRAGPWVLKLVDIHDRGALGEIFDFVSQQRIYPHNRSAFRRRGAGARIGGNFWDC